MLWGFFKKIVIADNCATYVNQIFANSESYDGSTLVIGAVFFAFQVYGDFSGYSDIAIGTARLFGIDLMKNFAYPFFSRNMAEFSATLGYFHFQLGFAIIFTFLWVATEDPPSFKLETY